MKKPFGPEYYQKRANRLGWGQKTARINPKLAQLLFKHIKGKKVIDIGCGSGIWTDFLTEKGYFVTGVDFVAQFISQAKKNKKGDYIIADAQNLPFEKNRFDTALLINVLEHVDDIDRVIRQASRVASRLIINLPQTTPQRLMDRGLVYKHHLDRSHRQAFSQKSIKAFLKKNCLKLVKICPMEPLPTREAIIALTSRSGLFAKTMVHLLLLTLPTRKYYLEFFVVAERKD